MPKKPQNLEKDEPHGDSMFSGPQFVFDDVQRDSTPSVVSHLPKTQQAKPITQNLHISHDLNYDLIPHSTPISPTTTASSVPKLNLDGKSKTNKTPQFNVPQPEEQLQQKI